jgi:hypothetical protein
MSISATFFAKTDYRFLYDFLLVMTDEQIQKLRKVSLGFEKISVFTESEIEDLEKKAGHADRVAATYSPI